MISNMLSAEIQFSLWAPLVKVNPSAAAGVGGRGQRLREPSYKNFNARTQACTGGNS
jgi:hypothetical protein